jgi:fructose-bisphosphate aldolase/6-deoxy-5-ketofructose 1-phosphate synthase
MNKKFVVEVPADIPKSYEDEYRTNYTTITHGTGNLMLFAADQKIEHLNKDFYGQGIAGDANNPGHLFKIAENGRIGAFATHLGLIARYGNKYKDINYIVKLNGKTNLVPTEEQDPVNSLLWDVEDVVTFKKNSGLSICGIGLTLYIGSTFESTMLYQAAQAIWQAHQHGLMAIIWVYPRGKSVAEERDGQLIAGAAGLAASLGADFVKVNPPKEGNGLSSEQWLAIAAEAAGTTKVICSGGEKTDQKDFLETLHNQIEQGTVAGNATGRNIHGRSLEQAIAMTKAISAITLDGASVDEATALLAKK